MVYKTEGQSKKYTVAPLSCKGYLPRPPVDA